MKRKEELEMELNDIISDLRATLRGIDDIREAMNESKWEAAKLRLHLTFVNGYTMEISQPGLFNYEAPAIAKAVRIDLSDRMTKLEKRKEELEVELASRMKCSPEDLPIVPEGELQVGQWYWNYDFSKKLWDVGKVIISELHEDDHQKAWVGSFLCLSVGEKRRKFRGPVLEPTDAPIPSE